MARGIAEDEAIDSVDLELQGRIDKEALSLYKIYLENTLLLQNGSVHADVQDDLFRFWDNGFTASRAAKMAANKHSDIIQGLMEPESDSDEDSNSNSSEDGLQRETPVRRMRSASHPPARRLSVLGSRTELVHVL